MKFTFSATTIHIKDLEKSLAFYQGLLGLEVSRRIPTPQGGIAFVGNADTQIELIQGPAPEGGYSGFSVGFTVDNLEAATEKLSKAGYPRQSGPITPGPQSKVTFSFFKDPDGVTVELLQNL
jgi:lactoylglutathione lyase